MGKLLVKFGMWIQDMWCKSICSWNAFVIKLIVKVDNCPNKLCKCK